MIAADDGNYTCSLVEGSTTASKNYILAIGSKFGSLESVVETLSLYLGLENQRWYWGGGSQQRGGIGSEAVNGGAVFGERL